MNYEETLYFNNNQERWTCMRIGYDDMTKFAQKVVDSGGIGVKFDKRRTDSLYEWQDLDKSFALYCNPTLHDISLINIKDKDGNAVFQKKLIELTYRSFEGVTWCSNMFRKMSVYFSSGFVKFDDKIINAGGVFDGAKIGTSKSPLVISGGDLGAARMFANSTGVEELTFKDARFYDITGITENSEIKILTFENCDLACHHLDFEVEVTGCIHNGDSPERINIINCSDVFVNAIVKNIKKYGKSNDFLMITIKD